MAKRVGILTGGGDCPGLNAVIRAVTRRSLDRGWEVAGVREGWRGLLGGEIVPLGSREISGILPRLLALPHLLRARLPTGRR